MVYAVSVIERSLRPGSERTLRVWSFKGIDKPPVKDNSQFRILSP